MVYSIPEYIWWFTTPECLGCFSRFTVLSDHKTIFSPSVDIQNDSFPASLMVKKVSVFL